MAIGSRPGKGYVEPHTIVPEVALRDATLIIDIESSPKQESMRFTSRWLTWLCLSLMLWGAVAESTHSHPNKTESASCSICVVAHGTAVTPTSNHIRPIFAAIGVLQQEDVVAKAGPALLEFGIRGPPAL